MIWWNSGLSNLITGCLYMYWSNLPMSHQYSGVLCRDSGTAPGYWWQCKYLMMIWWNSGLSNLITGYLYMYWSNLPMSHQYSGVLCLDSGTAPGYWWQCKSCYNKSIDSHKHVDLVEWAFWYCICLTRRNPLNGMPAVSVCSSVYPPTPCWLSWSSGVYFTKLKDPS